MREFVKSLYPYIKKHKTIALMAVLLSIPLSAIKGAQIYLIKHVVDILAPGSQFMDAVKIAAALLLLGLLNFPARFFHFYLIRYVVDKATCYIRDDIYAKLQRLPLGFFTTRKSGTLVSNILNDSSVFSQGFRSVIDLIREPLTALVMLGVAIYTDWQLTLIIFLVGPLFVFIFVVSGKKVKASQEEVQEYMAHMTHNVSEGVHGQKITKAFNLQDYVMKRFQKAQDLFFKFQMRTTLVEEMAHPLVELVGAIAFAGVILFAYYRIQLGHMTLGELIQFIGAMALIMDPLRKYSQANVKVNQAIAAADRIWELMKVPEEIDHGDIELKEFKDSIVFDHVTFAYEGSEQLILQELNLTIKKGEKVGVVGLSGAGKSTLINLLLRLYPITSGEIRIDGIPLQRYTLESLRQIFGLVSQDIFLFHDTVKENIKVGHQYSLEQIDRALETAGAKEFIAELPKGTDTVIGDRGTRLSGGQGQRVTIARAVLQNPSILLFDEATSALDGSSEKLVQEALERWSSDKTVLAVAHRLSTIQNYDKIIVMRRGTIIEEGKHFDLLEKKGEYCKLYELGQKAQTVSAPTVPLV